MLVKTRPRVGAGRRVTADELQALDPAADELEVDALLQEEAARQPLEAHPAVHVVGLVVQVLPRTSQVPTKRSSSFSAGGCWGDGDSLVIIS